MKVCLYLIIKQHDPFLKNSRFRSFIMHDLDEILHF